MSHDPYAPKQRTNPAADIVDLNRPPAFLLKQDRARLVGVAAIADEMTRSTEATERLASYIDGTADQNGEHETPQPPLGPVAGLKLLLRSLTYTEMKQVAAGILAGAEHDKVTAAGGMADALEAWSSEEKAA